MKRFARRVLAPAAGSLAGLWALWSVYALALGPDPLEPLPFVGNASIREIRVGPDEPWSVMLMADVQDGYHCIPELLRRGAALAPKAVIVLGDLSADHDEEHARLPARMFRRHPPSAPLFVAPGNHDIRGESGRAPFLAWYGSTTFEVKIGRARFLGADNSGGPLSSAALDELEARLAAARGEDVILCIHRDIFDWPGKHNPGAEAENAALLELIRKHAVKMVLCGHHHYSHSEVRGPTRFVIAPTSGNRSHDTGQNPVSFLMLRWTGREYVFDLGRTYRSNASELIGQIDHVALSHLRPPFERHPLAFGSLLVLTVLACAGGWFVRSKA